MTRHRVRNGILALLAAAVAAGASVGLSDLAAGQPASQAADPTVSASIGSTPTGSPLPRSFVGLSIEFNWLRFYTGRNPKRIDPVFLALIRNLAPGQPPVVRIGGESTDATWWPIGHRHPPPGISFTLTPHWLHLVKALAAELRARMVIGVNFAANRPGLAAAEARAFLSGIGHRYIEALELGNEPDNYGIFPWYRTQQGRGRWIWARTSSYSLSNYIADFSRFRTALPPAPLAGPAFAELTWLNGLGQFLDSTPKLRLATVHRYPLHGCLTSPSQAGYPSAANLLSDQASSGLAQAIAPSVAVAHAHRVAFRLDEMNSAAVASCLGKHGVSGTFASALWVLDTLFDLASVGVDGVNVHTLPAAAYNLFAFTHTKRGWKAFVHPEYYGMLLFAQAFPAGARLLPVSVSQPTPLKVWATRAKDGTTRIVLINKDPGNAYQVNLELSSSTVPGRLVRLQAPSLGATYGVSLGGQTFGRATRTGALSGPMQIETVKPAGGTYAVTVPPGSAALLTL